MEHLSLPMKHLPKDEGHDMGKKTLVFPGEYLHVDYPPLLGKKIRFVLHGSHYLPELYYLPLIFDVRLLK